MKTIALVNLGENLSVNLNKLSRKLNSLQQSLHFEKIESRPNIGPPDIDDIWYDFDNLFEQLRSHCKASSFDYVIGITHVKVTNKNLVNGKNIKDFFSYSDLAKFSVITEAMADFKPSTKNNYQYLSFLILEVLLHNMCRQNLCHSETRFCLFDDCEDRSAFTSGMVEGKICKTCEGILTNKNIDQATLNDIKRILKWCKKNSKRISVISTFKNPLSSVILGSLLGWLATIFLPNTSLTIYIILAGIALIHLFLFVYYYFS